MATCMHGMQSVTYIRIRTASYVCGRFNHVLTLLVLYTISYCRRGLVEAPYRMAGELCQLLHQLSHGIEAKPSNSQMQGG